MAKNIYLLPGTMCDHRLWSYMESWLNKRFPGQYRCHFLPIAQSGDMDALLADIKRQLPLEPVVLMGFSLGGYLATEFAVRHPKRIGKLLVVANQPTVLPEQEIKERTRTVDWIKRNGYSGIPKKRVLAFLDKSAHHKKELIELIQTMDTDLGGDVLVHQLLATTKRQNLFDRLAQLAIQSHYCVGDNDNLVDVNGLKAWADGKPHCSVTVFEDTGHMLPLEQGPLLANWLAEKV